MLRRDALLYGGGDASAFIRQPGDLLHMHCVTARSMRSRALTVTVTVTVTARTALLGKERAGERP